MTCGPVKLSFPWSPVRLLRNHLVSGFLGNSAGEEFICNAGDPSLIPESGSSPGEGIGYPLQHSCLENSMNRGAGWAMVHGVTKSQTRQSNFHSLTQSSSRFHVLHDSAVEVAVGFAVVVAVGLGVGRRCQ